MIFHNYKQEFLFHIKKIKYFILCIILIISNNIYCKTIDYNQNNIFYINKITIFGLDKFNKNNIMQNLPIKKGDYIKNEDLTKLVHMLFDIGIFEKINIFRNKNHIVIKFVEKPIISNIFFSGNKLLKNDILLNMINNIGITKGIIIDYPTLFFVKKQIEHIYLDNGMFNSKVKIKIIKNTQNNNVIIKFIIYEGVISKIKQINILGNHFYPKEYLLYYSKWNSRKSFIDFFFNNNYHTQYIHNFIENLKNFYLNQGFALFKIEYISHSFSKNKKNIYITLKINENKKFLFSNIIYIINKKEFLNKIKNLTEIKSGDLYNNNKIIQCKNKIINVLGKNGYLYPQIKILNKLNISNHSVQITFNIYTGKKYFIRKIEYLGNYLTKDKILRNETVQMENTWFNSDLVKQTKKRLNLLGYFNNIEIFLKKNHVLNNTIDLIYKVNERDSGMFNIHFGYSTNHNFSLLSDIGEDNFLGTGNDINIKINIDSLQTYLEFSLMNSYFLKNNISLGTKLFFHNLKIKNSNLINKSRGISGILTYPLSKNLKIQNNLEYNINNFLDVKPQISVWNYLKKIGYKFNLNNSNMYIINNLNLNNSFILNTLNDKFLPTKGNLSILNIIFNIPISKSYYYKINLCNSTYVPLYSVIQNNKLNNFSKLIFLFKNNIGYGNGFSNGNFPYNKNFFLGGQETLRGFKINHIGPKAIYYNSSKHFCKNKHIVCTSNDYIGGNLIVDFSTEIIFPFPFIKKPYSKNIRTSIFLDIGNIWDTLIKNDYLIKLYKFSKVNILTNMRSSIGMSFKWNSPFGAIVFSYAYPLIKYDQDQIEQFQFNIGKL
ncbi:outer membrane protein assembly factor BamA [Enterobacteriaceae endosymbiont of Plateumaris consimilis]|uniref:outer membrane protein assembly factor BamA n=1 Tax=Enterobacteriaceae endosymbiont of Plateumaris consimilis TaxID=2675794 RepID=UPI001449B992|nr:outer membrane protein assembly factor BamA [Enterobacteriaceae endosymbiont of Plateumaris consimilis]QJC28637.1 outer membrane protein assembly factor BamA [Enterobacteriaceae endosymbiont of Plateumaris consimilis]